RYSARNSATQEAVLPVVIPDGTSSNTFDVIRMQSGEERHFDLRPVTGRTFSVMAKLESGSGRGSDRGFPRISVRSANGSSFSISAVRNGESDVYRLDLPSGTYTLAGSMHTPEGFEEAESTVTVAGHDVSGVVLRFMAVPSLPVEMVVDPAATSDNANAPSNLLQILGLSLKNNQPDSERGDATIRLTPQRGSGLRFAVPPGSYRLGARNSGAWYVKSATSGDADLLQQSLVVAPGSGGAPIRVTVSNLTGSLQGTVRLNGEGANCWVYLVPSGPSARTVISLRSSAEGAYSFPYLPPGSYQAIAFQRRHAVDYGDPASLTAYATHVGSVSVQSAGKATLDLDAVSDAEIVP
ncbi:MAG: hypothetical protein ABI072_06145, partial [Edaphobacter sp.]